MQDVFLPNAFQSTKMANIPFVLWKPVAMMLVFLLYYLNHPMQMYPSLVIFIGEPMYEPLQRLHN
jgi:hypothetical protein